MVQEIYEGDDTFNKYNFKTLLNKISGKSGASIADVDALASSTRTAAQIRSGNGGKDVEVRFGGLRWEVVYLSKDKSGNAILTLWLDQNSQAGWGLKSAAEGAYYGFYNGGLYSDWAADWYTTSTSNGTAAFYPSNMYGTSYIRAVTLNNDGYYATNNSAITPASQSTSNVFAKFTMPSATGSVTKYLVKPEKVSWQEKQSATATGGASSSYDYPNDEWNPDAAQGKYYSDAYNYQEHNHYSDWKGDYIWLPSIAETGYNTTYTGLWKTSTDQRKNYDGSTTSISGQKVGSSNTKNVSSLFTSSWLRSGYGTGADYASSLAPSGGGYGGSHVGNSQAVRPCLHLNLDEVAKAIPETWEDFAEPFDTGAHTGDSAEDAYEISTAEQLAYIAQQVNTGAATYSGKYFKQTANISLGGHDWAPIGTYDSAYSYNGFSGVYDGGNYKIEGISINSTKDNQGLFGCVYGSSSKNAEIKNIIMQSGSISGGSYVGAIVANASYATIDGCKNFALVKGTDDVGGIFGAPSSGPGGMNVNCSISNCVNVGDVFSDGGAGGIAGEISQISNCINNATIVGKVVGGICSGTLSGTTGSITKCLAFGHILCSDTSGGIVGSLASGGTITACSFNGTSNSSLSLVGRSSSAFSQVASWISCNGKITTSAAVNDSWTQYWAVVNNINGGLPILKDLYAIASVVDSTAAEIADALK